MDFYICARSWNQSPMDTKEQLAVQREMKKISRKTNILYSMRGILNALRMLILKSIKLNASLQKFLT